jgi:transposase
MAERPINGRPPDERLAARRQDVAPSVWEFIDWMTRERAELSRHNEVAKAMDYMLKRRDAFTCFLDDGRICLSNNPAERQLRGIALGREAWLFAGSDRGGQRAAVMFTLIQTAKLNDVDPQAWLADVLAWIADHKITDLAALLPWNWRLTRLDRAARPWRRRPMRSRSAALPKYSARPRSCCGNWPIAWTRRTAASGSTAPATKRRWPSPIVAWNPCAS